MRKKGIPYVMMKAVTSLYEEAAIGIKVGSGYSDKFSVRVGVHQGSILLPFLIPTVLDVITEGVWVVSNQ